MATAMTISRELPDNLPFYVGDILGTGAFATVRVCRDLNTPDLYAVKFIDKIAALDGNDSKSRKGVNILHQISLEVSLHKVCADHRNVIKLIATNETPIWRWIAMEWAEGGDLFDKIDPDVGVDEDIAQFYFMQLLDAIKFCHGKGVAHRDIKPENLLLDGDGNLKVGDFGLSALFKHDGKTRLLNNVCGSPPYVAPEVAKKGTPYQGPPVDAWSCGVVLFTLLVGNTPWDEPTVYSPEYRHYVSGSKKFLRYDPWNRLDEIALSLVCALMNEDPQARMTVEEAMQHPWVTRPNRVLSNAGYLADPLNLAQRLMEKLQVDLNGSSVADSLSPEIQGIFSQPEPRYQSGPVPQYQQRNGRQAFMSSSQPVTVGRPEMNGLDFSQLSEEPSMSQFTSNPHLPESLTQRASRFKDLCPPERLTQFYSVLPRDELLEILIGALQTQHVVTPNLLGDMGDDSGSVRLPIHHFDKRKCPLQGEIRILRYNNQGVRVVKFIKSRGDPLEFRRFFKNTAVHCKDAIYVA